MLKLKTIALSLILGMSLLPRIPLLYNAEAIFNADEAVDALVVKHLLEKGCFVTHNWDATYYGIVEGLISIPFAILLNFHPVAFKLGALLGHLMLITIVFFLGKRLYGTIAGLIGSSILVVFSPQVIMWSTLASGGYLLVIAWGALSLYFLYDLRRNPKPLHIGLFGCLVGFGLYIYELYIIFVALFVVSAFLSSSFWSRVRPNSIIDTLKIRFEYRRCLINSAAFMTGLAVGWAPKLAVLLNGDIGNKKPLYGLADPQRIFHNIKLLTNQCLPALLGINPFNNPGVEAATGPVELSTRIAGFLLGTIYLISWCWAVNRQRNVLSRLVLIKPVMLNIESLLVLLIPATILSFILSLNPVEIMSSRYLLPIIISISVLTGAWLTQCTRLKPLLGVLIAVLLFGLPAVQSTNWLRAHGFIEKNFQLVQKKTICVM